LRASFLFSSPSGQLIGSALFAFFPGTIRLGAVRSTPFALFPRVVRTPVFGRAYSTTPTLFHAGLHEIIRKTEGEGPGYLREYATAADF
jgi:hypothetical protein